MTLKYDQSAVSHWLSGTQPRAQVRPVIVEVLERKLGRPVTYAEAGLRSPKPGPAVDSTDTTDSLLDLGRADMDPSRRGVLAAGLYSAALTVPLFAGEAYAEERERSVRPTGRIGAAEVATVRTMTDRIADILDELGAGHARPMAAAFLVNTVAPYLRASATGPVRRDMLSAASDLTYLTGWMAMYERAHGLGQQYYVKALRLAQEASDHVTYCRTLRGMSLQASNLRYGHKALSSPTRPLRRLPMPGRAWWPSSAGSRPTPPRWSETATGPSSGCARPKWRSPGPIRGGSRSAATTRPPTSSTWLTCSTRHGTCQVPSQR